ncbi:DUF501 domain-containing protein [Orenia marismortui]|uniref:DUF501 domain-containing protein n=1 Tax=Orenia marismortui TaxID=46469 RepID=A0A4R8GGN6_9FIRM|nr:DUF501 domain-containing protein [Orenia marismortui]TDX44395.1 hypothetical protein C7959_15610 [Orenia marismortui]
MKCTKRDLEILEKQLGRKPRNVVEIATRCKNTNPQVIVTSPILEKKDSVGIFPTTFWLACPELNYRISKLESKGLVQEIQDEILSDEELSRQLEEAHKNYANYRLNLVDKDRLEELKSNNYGQYKVLKDSGVGGILEFDGIKCLHTHYAHYLVDKINPVGKKVDELLVEEYGTTEIEECCVDCSSSEED